MNGNVLHLNPAGLHKNPEYSQAVVVSGNATTIYVGGQNAVDASGTGIFVPALARPDFLVEIDAIAVIPQK